MPVLLMLLLGLPQAAARPADATALAVAAPSMLLELDAGELKGDPVRLCWSPDGAELYLQTGKRERTGQVSDVRHYVIKLGSTNLKPEQVNAEPAWAANYWGWKSAQAAPGLPTLKIELDERREVVWSISNMGGGAAVAGLGADPAGAGVSAGPGVSGGGAAGAAAGAKGQNAMVYTMLLKGEIIGRWVNAPIVPGLTFGWAPKGLGLIAFANRDGKLVIMDEQGRKQEVADTDDVLLPAWSDEASRVAYLSKGRGKKYELRLIQVEQSQ